MVMQELAHGIQELINRPVNVNTIPVDLAVTGVVLVSTKSPGRLEHFSQNMNVNLATVMGKLQNAIMMKM